jgi:hypothetical protein
MKDDVKKYIYGTVIVFVVGVLAFLVGIVYTNACGFTLSCKRGALAVERTPIPTLIPANMPVMESGEAAPQGQCRVAAADLIGAWVDAGSPETDAFEFVDASGQNCASTFEEVRPLFIESNLWYAGSMSCVTCHTADVATSSAQLDLGTYAGINAGSRRADAESKGTDILGAGKWASSLLFDFVTTSKADVPGHADISSDLLIFAGTLLPEATPTP